MESNLKNAKSKFPVRFTEYKWGVAAILIGLLGWIDYGTGHELRFAPLYLIPIAFVTWTLGRNQGLAISVISTAVWFISNFLAGMSYSTRMVPIWNIFVRQFTFSIFVYLLYGFKLHREEARHDYLTQIFNKRLFYECATRELARCHRYQKPITIGYIDCDDFKKVNDLKGHEAGDQLLRHMAKNIQKELRATDIVARLGGDEFAVLLPGTNYDSSQEVFNKIRLRLRAVGKNEKGAVTFSIGVVTYQVGPETVKEMVQKADELMYKVKHHSKNNIEHEVIYSRLGVPV